MVQTAAQRTVVLRGRRAGWWRWVKGAIAVVLAAGLAYHSYIAFHIVHYRSSNPSATALMNQRISEARARGVEPVHQQIWVPFERISPNLVRGVLAGEDSKFFDHSGFDQDAIRDALEKNWEKGQFARGASTISQQLAKNLFLSTSKNPLRKLHEALITWEMELLLGKRRILELYLNVIEWGDGIYGAEAAARHYFNTSASSLNPQQAAFLSAIIPNPRTFYNPKTNPKRVERRRSIILRRMKHVSLPKEYR